MKTKVIIVHGEKQLPNGSIHPEYVDRLLRARMVSSQGDTIVLTGGKTRAHALSESEQACDQWLFEHAQEYERGGMSTLPRILIEEESRTTQENILHAARVLKKKNIIPDEIIAIARVSAIPKTKYLYKRLWNLGTPKITVIEGKDTKSLLWRIADRTIFFLIAVLDPRDRWILALPKKIFRNG